MITYAKAGVSIDAGNELVRRIKKIVAGKSKLSPIGGFSGLYPLPGGRQFLSGCCDGVGTKLKVAFLLDRHDTVGIDLVAMNVNDLICTGARPLFFLDYFACGKLEVDTAEAVIRGIQRGCEEAGALLLGGETAEMPGFYPKGEYDLAGFALGLAEKGEIIDGKKTRPGDCVIGVPSSGIHSNGYSLVRKVFSDREMRQRGKVLLEPTRIYVKEALSLFAALRKKRLAPVRGIAHVTGGGWTDNIPRVLPEGLEFAAVKGSWRIPPIFAEIQKRARASEAEMFRTFNMGIGLVVAAAPESAATVLGAFKGAVLLGKIRKGKAGVSWL